MTFERSSPDFYKSHLVKTFPRIGSITNFSFNDKATTEIYTLSLHDALPISNDRQRLAEGGQVRVAAAAAGVVVVVVGDRKSTRLNSSHGSISYAVLCLK